MSSVDSTTRVGQVRTLLASGLKQREIAERLGISQQAVSKAARAARAKPIPKPKTDPTKFPPTKHPSG